MAKRKAYGEDAGKAGVYQIRCVPTDRLEWKVVVKAGKKVLRSYENKKDAEKYIEGLEGK